jgi:hypothetical protein
MFCPSLHQAPCRSVQRTTRSIIALSSCLSPTLVCSDLHAIDRHFNNTTISSSFRGNAKNSLSACTVCFPRCFLSRRIRAMGHIATETENQIKPLSCITFSLPYATCSLKYAFPHFFVASRPQLS